jgi:GTPase SAR1 family protein
MLERIRNPLSPAPEPVAHDFNRSLDSTLPGILVGNKCDTKAHKVTTDEGRDLASRLRLGFFEASANDGTNVDRPFFEIIREMRRHDKENPLNANFSRDCYQCIVM